MERLKGCSRKLMILLALLVLTAGLALPAAADMGPKPSVEVVFRGLEGQRYQVTLLADVTQYGPWSANQGYSDWMGDPEGWDAFAGYPAPEGWYFLGEYADCTETGRFVWSYYPPETFYVLVWLPDSGRYLCSTQPVSRYAFDSRFTAAVEGNALTVQPSYDYAGEAAGLVVRAALTILLETAAAWLLFGLRRRDQWILILKVNLVTQLALNLCSTCAAISMAPCGRPWRMACWNCWSLWPRAGPMPGGCGGARTKNPIPGCMPWRPTSCPLRRAGNWPAGCRGSFEIANTPKSYP